MIRKEIKWAIEEYFLIHWVCLGIQINLPPEYKIVTPIKDLTQNIMECLT